MAGIDVSIVAARESSNPASVFAWRLALPCEEVLSTVAKRRTWKDS